MWRRVNDFVGWHDWVYWTVKASRELARAARSITSCHEQRRPSSIGKLSRKNRSEQKRREPNGRCPFSIQTCFPYKNIISRRTTAMFLAKCDIHKLNPCFLVFYFIPFTESLTWGHDESICYNAKWRNGFADETQVEADSLEMDGTFEQVKPPRRRCLVSKIKFATTDKTTSTVAKTSDERPGPDRNSRRPRTFAGSVDSLNSIHRAPELRIIQLRVFSVPLSIHRRGDQTFAVPLHFRTMHYLAPIVLDNVRAFTVPLTEDYR